MKAIKAIDERARRDAIRALEVARSVEAAIRSLTKQVVALHEDLEALEQQCSDTERDRSDGLEDN